MILNLFIIVLMIFLTAFFVAAEFSLVKIRKSRLETLEKENNKRAKLALNIVNHLDSYLSACQLGITLTSLAIGWVGESTMHSILAPLLSYVPLPSALLDSLSIILAFLLFNIIIL